MEVGNDRRNSTQDRQMLGGHLKMRNQTGDEGEAVGEMTFKKRIVVLFPVAIALHFFPFKRTLDCSQHAWLFLDHVSHASLTGTLAQLTLMLPP